MLAKELLNAFREAGKRTHLIGTMHTGLLIALDMEGRLFTILNGKIMNRVNMDAVMGRSTTSVYLNPGGDALWPAPEGTSLGYQYPSGPWRPSPSLRSAVYLVTHSTPNMAMIEAEVDLINNRGTGLPTIFRRKIYVTAGKHVVTVRSTESIRYIGSSSLKKSDALLAPWSLCQFDSGENCKVIFPIPSASSVWDLYDEPSQTQRVSVGGICHLKTDGSMRFQVAMKKNIPWIEYHDPGKSLIVKRIAQPLVKGQNYIDIRDALPRVLPSAKGVRYSVYSDPAMFMEIEAVGGCPSVIRQGTEMSVNVGTRYQIK